MAVELQMQCQCIAWLLTVSWEQSVELVLNFQVSCIEVFRPCQIWMPSPVLSRELGIAWYPRRGLLSEIFSSSWNHCVPTPLLHLNSVFEHISCWFTLVSRTFDSSFVVGLYHCCADMAEAPLPFQLWTQVIGFEQACLAAWRFCSSCLPTQRASMAAQAILTLFGIQSSKASANDSRYAADMQQICR